MPLFDHQKFYLGAYKKYGKTPQGLCWHSLQSQQLRFEKIYQALPQDLSSYTLIDCGCGFGDFYLYLKQKNNLPKRYIGIEEQKCFVDIASKATSQKIIWGDFLTLPHLSGSIYICSGVLNTLTKFESILFLQKMLQNATSLVVFNFLYQQKKQHHFNVFTQEEILNILKKHRLVYKAVGYLCGDCTIGVQPYPQGR